MARRRKRKKNPSKLQWALIGTGAAAVGVGGYFAVRAYQRRRWKEKLSKLPPPVPDDQLEGAITEPDVPCGREYPGFVPVATGGCEPGPKTPPGVYVADACSDFVFVTGDDGPQPDYLEAMIARQALETSNSGALSADPPALVSDFLARFWPECMWPPAPDAPARIVNLYAALSIIVGEEIAKTGGRVLGTTDAKLVEDLVQARLAELGYPTFDPTVVPEFKLGPQTASSGNSVNIPQPSAPIQF